MDKMWFHARGQDKKGPVPETELKNLINSGAVFSTDLVWCEGMANWAPASTIFGTESAAATLASSPASATLPQGLTGWMSFVGIVNIIYGAISCLSCIGIITGVFLIIGGAALMAARKMLDGIGLVDPKLLPFFNKMKTFIQMTGIMYLITLIGLVLALIAYAGVFAAILATGLHMKPE